MVELWVVFVVGVLVGACLRDIVIKITIHFGVEEIAEVVNRKSAVDHIDAVLDEPVEAEELLGHVLGAVVPTVPHPLRWDQEAPPARSSGAGQ